jgi:hypothetical protein
MGVCVAAGVFLQAFGSGAMAATPAPAWNIHSVAQPTNFSAGDTADCESNPEGVPPGPAPCDTYRVVVRNVGGAASSGPVTITDALPSEGFTVRFVKGIELQEGLVEANPMECSSEPYSSPVTCSYSSPVPPDGVLIMSVNVSVAPGLPREVLNAATVEGGGAISMSTSEPSTSENGVNGTSETRFGIADFGISVNGVDGRADENAADHPFGILTNLDLNSIKVTLPAEGLKYGPPQEPKNVAVYLPPGFIGDPQAVEQCTPASLVLSTYQAGCPRGSIVGTVTVDLHGEFLNTGVRELAATSLYNLTPEAGYPAEFGFTYLGIPVFMYASLVHRGSEYMIRVSAHGIPEEELVGFSLEFFGNPSEKVHNSVFPAAFLTNPSRCSAGPLNARVELDSWEEPNNWVSAESTVYQNLTGCNLLQFNPELTVSPEVTKNDTPSNYEVDLRVPQALNSFASLASPDLKDAVVVLPEGLNISPSAANGLVGCAATGPNGIDIPSGVHNPATAEEGEAIGADSLSHLTPGNCPTKSRVGEVEISTPLLSAPLKGSVYVAQPSCGVCTEADAEEGRMVGLYIEAEGFGVVLKLAGKVEVGGYGPHSQAVGIKPGQLRTTFTENPQLPVEDVKLRINGGQRSSLSNPQTCGRATTVSAIVPWSYAETPTANPSSFFNVNGCSGSPGFAPGFTAGTVTPLAGGFSPFTLTLTRKDGDQNLGGVSVQMPPGLAGMLAKVPLCGEPAAQQGSCPEASRIGTVSAAAGAGSEPLWLSGPVYLTGPYNGAPFGLSIVVPAVAGPFNLGNVVERASINVDVHTAQVTTTSGPLQQSRDGIPFRLKAINVTVDRPEFIFNPTDCSQLGIRGTVAGVMPNGLSGTSVPVSNQFAVTGCKNLPFKPSFRASTKAFHSRKNGAGLHVSVGSATGQANIREVKVELPRVLPSRLSTLKLACTEKVFEANPAACPKGSRVGTAVAHTPVLSVPLTGPAYFVSHGSAKFPELVVVLQGEGVTVILNGETFISKSGITRSTFRTVPDVPVTKFDLELPTGPTSALAGTANLCKNKLVMPTTIKGQNGAIVKQSTKVSVSGCPKAKKKRKPIKGKRGGKFKTQKKK